MRGQQERWDRGRKPIGNSMLRLSHRHVSPGPCNPVSSHPLRGREDGKESRGRRAAVAAEATEAIGTVEGSFQWAQYRAKLPQTSIRTIPGDPLARKWFSESANKTPARIILLIPFPISAISGYCPHGQYSWLVFENTEVLISPELEASKKRKETRYESQIFIRFT